MIHLMFVRSRKASVYKSTPLYTTKPKNASKKTAGGTENEKPQDLENGIDCAGHSGRGVGVCGAAAAGAVAVPHRACGQPARGKAGAAAADAGAVSPLAGVWRVRADAVRAAVWRGVFPLPPALHGGGGSGPAAAAAGRGARAAGFAVKGSAALACGKAAGWARQRAACGGGVVFSEWRGLRLEAL